jgi:hypothetical protein
VLLTLEVCTLPPTSTKKERIFKIGRAITSMFLTIGYIAERLSHGWILTVTPRQVFRWRRSRVGGFERSESASSEDQTRNGDCHLE